MARSFSGREVGSRSLPDYNFVMSAVPALAMTASGRVQAEFGPEPVIFRAQRSLNLLIGETLYGAGDRNRTGDPVITSDVLYQLSYTSSHVAVSASPRPRVADRGRARAARGRGVMGTDPRGDDDGATPQNRTGDTRIFSAVLYQLS